MTSGGERVRSGPGKDPNRSSRGGHRGGGFVHLPASGRDGDTPPWPLPGRATKFELETWEVMWRRPEAVEWDRLGMEAQVALYVKTLRASMQPRAAATMTRNVLSMEDRLGLSIAGRAKNGWIIDDVPQAPAAPRRTPSSTAKDRIRVLTGGKDARAS